jgi:hypothetical protein
MAPLSSVNSVVVEKRLYLRCNKLGASRSASAIGHSLHQWNGCHEQRKISQGDVGPKSK